LEFPEKLFLNRAPPIFPERLNGSFEGNLFFMMILYIISESYEERQDYQFLWFSCDI